MKLQITAEQTLLDALEKLSPDSSKTTLRSWLKDGRVLVDGSIEKVGSKLLQPGQVVSMGIKPSAPIDGLRILYQDSHLVIIDKPSSMLSVAAAFDKTKTAHAVLKNYFRPNKVYVVHRLDQDTSGVMMFALSEVAYEKLKEIFEEHKIIRQYIAVVEGQMEDSKGTWESYLYEDDFYMVHVTTIANVRARLAITHYEVLEKTKAYTLVKFTLETGRKNQIRVQCKAAGHSIVGDTKYGAVRNPIKRLCLHAQHLGFVHPVTGKKMFFESEMPIEFKNLMKGYA